MTAKSQHAGLIPTQPGRWLLLVAIGLAGGALLLTTVALASMGSSEFTSVVGRWLDDNHVWGERTELFRAAKRYETADPVADAERAIAVGDARLLPAAGIGAFFPGLEDESFADYSKRFGEKELIYAGCVVNSQEEGRFRDAAYKYAVEYNRTVVARGRP